ncbi:MAG TPA: 4-hydroxybenzoate octaprenyltransferase [Leucothrix sp.]|nr:4-hydroxybenzoate octaprenyltransferase [Leucothrix sp.]
MLDRLKLYAELVRLNRPIGIYLLLWPTLWALWFAAKGIPDMKILIIFVLGVIFMRSAGCAINDYADRDIDKHVARTQERPLTSGKITSKEALGVFAILVFASFLLVLQLNTSTIFLSVIAVLLATSYPFTKRYHYFPQVHLGAAFAWAIPMAYTAITNNPPPIDAWLLFIAALLWTTAYDTQYGMVDREDDLKIGVKSTAILFAEHDNFINGTLQLLTLIMLTIIGMINDRGFLFYASIMAASGFVIYQQFLTENREPAKCLQAFLNNHWFGMTIFIGIALDYFVN